MPIAGIFGKLATLGAGWVSRKSRKACNHTTNPKKYLVYLNKPHPLCNKTTFPMVSTKKYSVMKCLHLLLSLTLIAFVLASCNKTAGGASGGSYSTTPGTLSSGGGGSSNSTGDTVHHTAGVLTAGEWNDHDNWDFWLALMGNDTFAAAQKAWGFACTARWNFTVRDANGNPVADAVVNIKNSDSIYWVCRTNKFGTARFLPVFSAEKPFANLTWQVHYNGTDYTSGNLSLATTDVPVTLPVAAVEKNAVDIMLVVDATGSMGDEMEYLKNELYNVLDRTEQQLGYDKLHYGAVFYRDRNSGDAYITKPFDFTASKGDLVSFVKQQSADGGGDYPEAVDEALEAALQQHWSTDAKARILFLVLDAPPHNAQSNLDLLHSSIQKAAEKGIMIIPITASGVDKPTEFLMRFMALATNGTYTFLTNDSGVGDNHITPTVGKYTVEYLNNLMVRLITKYAGR